MPAPSIIHDWRFAVSQSFSGASPAAMRQSLLRGLKNLLLGTGSYTDSLSVVATVTTPWEVELSCDSVATSAITDLWDADGDLVWAAEGVAHSWIVLTNPDYFGTGVPLSILLVCGPASTQNATLAIVISRAGFTGGTITARPTATDEHVVRPTGGSISTAGWQGDDNSATSLTMRLHFLMTADGRKFHIFFTRAAVCIAQWSLFDCDEDAGWTDPYLFTVASEDFAAGAEVELLTVAGHYRTDTERLWYGREEAGIGDFTVEAGIPTWTNAIATADQMPGLALNGFTGGWLPFPIVLRGIAPAAGPLAVVPDMWWAREAAGTGSGGADVATGVNIQFMQFGAVMVPWNDTTIVLG